MGYLWESPLSTAGQSQEARRLSDTKLHRYYCNMAPVGLKFFTGAKFKMERKIFRKTEEAAPSWTWDVKPGVVQLGEAWSLQAARATSGHRHKSGESIISKSGDNYSCNSGDNLSSKSGDNYSSMCGDSYSYSDTDSSSFSDSSSVISTESNVSK